LTIEKLWGCRPDIHFLRDVVGLKERLSPEYAHSHKAHKFNKLLIVSNIVPTQHVQLWALA